MAKLPRTSEALGDWQTNYEFGLGSHTDPTISVGAYSNLILGEVPFDPLSHHPMDIDHTSLMGAATGELYVTEVLPERPMGVNLVIDSTHRAEHPVVTRGKEKLAGVLEPAIEEALPGMSDHILTYRAVDGSSDVKHRYEEALPADDPESYAKNLKQLALGGLVFVITDGRKMWLPEGSLKGSPIVAIKINHKLELPLPANKGVLPVLGSDGRVEEVDTSSPKELRAINAVRKEEHAAIVENLQEAGVAVAEVVTDSQVLGFNLRQADKSIARAVNALNQ
jgi:hypothetical protein